MNKKIYFAGKIGRLDWRHDIALGLYRTDYNSFGAEEILPLDDNWYVGPFFISCDHSCGHGENTHGVGNKETTCFESPPRKEVFNKCINQITQCDYVFCWLDSNEAYGTLFELGVAYEKGKNIFLAIDEKFKNVNDFWFSKEGCWRSGYFNNHQEAWNIFLEQINPNFESEKKEFDELMNNLKEFEKDDYIELAKRQPMSKVIAYFKRNRANVGYLKQMYDGKCQIINCGYTFKKENGENYCETHHLLELFKYRLDDPKVMVCVCPNHHMLLHFGTDEEKSKIQFEYKEEHLKILEETK